MLGEISAMSVPGPPGIVRAPGDGEGPGLSPSEMKVATLVADGYTNREIANSLYVTPSTVEQHLTRIYRKLNIRTRAELVAQRSLLGGSDD